MASIEEDIVEWSKSRPLWQRNVLAQIARGEPIEQSYVDTLALQIVADEVVLEEPVLSLQDIPTAASAGRAVTLLSVGNLDGVNALLTGQTLTFGPAGLTVIYGDNGSGKSGYARLIKDVVQARHHEAILPNAYEAKPPGRQSAEIAFAIDGAETSSPWPSFARAELTQIGFYDEACGDDYLVSETELAYRPSVLRIFDQLVAVTDQLRAAVEVHLARNRDTRVALPKVEPGTQAADFLDDLSAKTTIASIDKQLEAPADEEQQLADALAEEARLKGTDPTKEKTRLGKASTQVRSLADRLETLQARLSPEAGEAVEKQLTDAKALRAAASAASSEQFKSEELAGVGGVAWRALWEAAQRYSEADAYPGRNFPATEEGDHCVLCQQPLDDGARGRLTHFHTFVHNDVAQRARAAEQTAAAAIKSMEGLTISTPDDSATIALLTTINRTLAESIESALEIASRALSRIGARLRGESDEPWMVLGSVDLRVLRALADGLKVRGDAIDAAGFQKALTAATKLRAELGAHVAVRRVEGDIKAERIRLIEEANLRKTRGALSTTSVTTKASQLTRTYVTAAVGNQFIRESYELRLRSVVLGDKGGSKGRLKHQPVLEGAQGHAPMDVLSEGEQTAAGLAGLFTEVYFDSSKSAIVLDDPVSSLDHERRKSAARRAVELARDRQVIIFTHDLTFLGELVKAATEKRVTLTERTIERDGEHRPGRVVNVYPWKAKDAKARLGELKAELERIETGRKIWTSEENEMRTGAWAGHLSETWERFVRSEVADRIVDGGTNEVRPQMFRLVARITEDDNLDFQAGYSAVSMWAMRHDKGDEVNLVIPSIKEMREELARAEAWFKRVNGYANAK